MITLICVLFHFLEAKHDYYVIENVGLGSQNEIANRKWHFWDALTWLAIYCTLGYVDHWLWIPIGLCVRLLMLQVVLNKLRGKKASYLGKNGLDGFFNIVFGPTYTLVLKVIFVLALLILNLYYRHADSFWHTLFF